jgi:hypothetical protein
MAYVGTEPWSPPPRCGQVTQVCVCVMQVNEVRSSCAPTTSKKCATRVYWSCTPGFYKCAELRRVCSAEMCQEMCGEGVRYSCAHYAPRIVYNGATRRCGLVTLEFFWGGVLQVDTFTAERYSPHQITQHVPKVQHLPRRVQPDWFCGGVGLGCLGMAPLGGV